VTLQRFPVRADPEFLIIEFFDNSLGAQTAPDLAAMASAADDRIAVLAVTDNFGNSARAIEITANALTHLEDLGTLDTGEPNRLGELLSRALISYPNAPHVAIGFAGHGSGIFDEVDSEPSARLFHLPRPPLLSNAHPVFQSLFFSLQMDRSGGVLTTKKLGRMLRKGLAGAGREGRPVDLIFFDTCLNGMIEVVTEIEEFADCIVGSPDLQPLTGWDYQQWFSRMTSSPPASASAWGDRAVEAMAATYAGSAERPITLSAVHARSNVTQCFAELVHRAQGAGPAGFRYLDAARGRTQDYGAQLVDSLDLGDFAVHLATNREIEEIAVAADALIVAIRGAVSKLVALDLARAHGLAFWFPALRRSFERDVRSYRGLAFDEQTGWSSYLDTYR